MKDSIRKAYLASVTDSFVKGQMDRRTFLRAAGKLGLGAGVLGMGLGARPFYMMSQAQAQEQNLKPSDEVMKWLADVGKPFAGTTLKLATESTPPSNAIATQLKQYFEEASGIKIEIEVLPLEQVDVLLQHFPELPVFPAEQDDKRKVSAAWMIESCGWKGFREGDAGVAPSHALVLVNHGNASGAELLALARRISASVLEKFGVPIEPEPRLLGAQW